MLDLLRRDSGDRRMFGPRRWARLGITIYISLLCLCIMYVHMLNRLFKQYGPMFTAPGVRIFTPPPSFYPFVSLNLWILNFNCAFSTASPLSYSSPSPCYTFYHSSNLSVPPSTFVVRQTEATCEGGWMRYRNKIYQSPVGAEPNHRNI